MCSRPGAILIAHDDVRDSWWQRFKRQINRPLIADWVETAQAARSAFIITFLA